MSYRNLTTKSLNSRLRDVWEDARLGRRIAAAAAGFGALSPLMALANPTGGQVVAGSAGISTPSANGTVINQTSQNAVINWQQFSVGANQYVQFLQPNSSAVVLNRVIGTDMSRIFGDIKANGQVFLVNPNGILFGKGAVLDAAGVVASTLDIKNGDFMQGKYLFAKGTSAPDAMVLNQGSLTAGRGGYVVLAGDYVENDGRIQAQGGHVYLAAGNSATMTLDKNQLISYTVDGATLARLAGVVNAGDIVATGGTVVMTGDVANALTATAVNNQGFIAAKSIQDHGGTIVLLATGGELVNSGTLDANAAASQGNTPGGTIIIHGDGKTELLPTSNINASGNGSGRGGFVDLSGHTLGVRGAATAGMGGTLLIDPATINIISGSATGGLNTSPNTVGVNFIQNQLNAGNNVEIVAGNTITYTGSPGKTLTAIGSLAAGKSLTIATGVVASCGIGGVCVGPPPFISSFNFGNITLTGLTLNIKSSLNIQTANGNVTVDGITANGGIFIGGGKISINGNLAANASVNISATPNGSRGFIHAAGKTISGTRVNLSLGAASYGGSISVGAINAISHAGVSVSQSVGTSNDTIKVGSITAPDISIGVTGFHDLINVGPITAVNPNGAASVHLNEFVHNGGNGAINVNGNITVSGKPGTNLFGALTQFDLPIAAGLFINVGGSGSADAHNVQVNGAINITAHGGAYSAGNCECGTPKRLQSGTGGAAVGFITVSGSHGAASVTGDITAKGPDAFVGVEAHGVTVQNVSVTGSGHNVTRSMGPLVTSGAYASNNSAGQANLILGTVAPTGSYGGPGVSATVKAGNLTVSGKGVADAGLFASNVSAGNITVTATAASGKITKDSGQVTFTTCSGVCANANSSGFYRGIGDVAMHTGSITGGRAVIDIAANRGGGSGSGAPGVSIKTGTLSATGVGQAFIGLDAKSIQTQALTVVATKGTEKGIGSSTSGLTAATHFAHTFNINGGEADIKIRSGNSASHSSGVLTLNGGPVTINGAISAKGPRAAVDIKGKTITVGGAVSVVGNGGTLTSTTVVTPPTGGGFSTSFSGPGRPTTVNLQGAASGSVNVAGKINVKGPGLVGAIVIGGNVTLNGLSGSASAVKTYVAKDTRIATAATTLTIGSLAVVVDDVKAAAGALSFTSAADTGDITLRSKGNVDMASRINVSGNLSVAAVGSIDGNSNGVVAHFNAVQNAVRAGNNSSGGGPSPGVLPNSAFQAKAMAMVAGKSLNMSGTQLTIGNGSISSVQGDAQLLQGLAALGLSPSAANPNGAFIAAGSVSLGALKLTGSYLLLQGAAVSLLGPVSVPHGALVQVLPFDPTVPIDIEDTLAASSVLTLATGPSSTFGLTNKAFISLFPGATIAVGDSTETGDVTLGANGPLDIGATNLVIFTLGSVTGLGTVTSTGIVNSLLSVLGPPIPPVTSGEVDPATGMGDQTDKKKFGGGAGVTGGGDQGGTISQDTTPSNVCH